MDSLGKNVRSSGFGWANGDEILGLGICKNVVLQLQGLEIVQNYLSLELGNSDLILGIQ